MPAVAAAEREQDPDDAREGVRLIKVEQLEHRCDITRSVRCFDCIDVHGGFVSSASSKESQPATSKTEQLRVNSSVSR